LPCISACSCAAFSTIESEALKARRYLVFLKSIFRLFKTLSLRCLVYSLGAVLPSGSGFDLLWLFVLRGISSLRPADSRSGFFGLPPRCFYFVLNQVRELSRWPPTACGLRSPQTPVCKIQATPLYELLVLSVSWPIDVARLPNVSSSIRWVSNLDLLLL